METIALFAFLGTTAFFINSRNWRGVFVVLAAGIAGREALIHFEKQSDQFVACAFAISAVGSGLLAWLLCRLMLGPAKALRTNRSLRKAALSDEDKFDDLEERIREQHYRDDMKKGLPNVPGDPSINIHWPDV